MSLQIGDEVVVDVVDVAHGGHFVARSEGATLFVRGTAPGERVRARIDGQAQSGRVLFASTVAVDVASPQRVAAPCPAAADCGGCDFQHLPIAYQRDLKTQVLRQQLQRLGGLAADHPVLANQVLPLGESETGLGWRTRVNFRTDANGRIGLYRHGTHEVVPVAGCPVAVPAINADGLANRPWAARAEVRAVASLEGRTLLAGAAEDVEISERVADFHYRLTARSFWQAHQAAPQQFVESALDLLRPKAGEHLLDLYAGVGLFTLPLAQVVGSGGRVDAVEGDRTAARYLRRNARQFSQVKVAAADVQRWLAAGEVRRCEAVLLDPPRTGAGSKVIDQLVRRRPSRILYVACDPAALGRDTKLLATAGYELAELRAWDAFPMTHHFETFALFSAR